MTASGLYLTALSDSAVRYIRPVGVSRQWRTCSSYPFVIASVSPAVVGRLGPGPGAVGRDGAQGVQARARHTVQEDPSLRFAECQ